MVWIGAAKNKIKWEVLSLPTHPAHIESKWLCQKESKLRALSLGCNFTILGSKPYPDFDSRIWIGFFSFFDLSIAEVYKCYLILKTSEEIIFMYCMLQRSPCTHFQTRHLTMGQLATSHFARASCHCNHAHHATHHRTGLQPTSDWQIE